MTNSSVESYVHVYMYQILEYNDHETYIMNAEIGRSVTGKVSRSKLNDVSKEFEFGPIF